MSSPSAIAEIAPARAITPSASSPALEAAFERELVRANEPAWLVERRRNAWLRCNRDTAIATDGITVGKKDERWRFSGHKGWALDAAVLSHEKYKGELPDIFQSVSASPRIAGRLRFVDDVLVDHKAVATELEKRGVIFLPLREAVARHADLLHEHLFRHDHPLGGDKFLALHHAYARSGTLLHVPDGVEIAETFIAEHWTSTPGAALFPHTLIITGANCKINFMDYYGSLQADGAAWVAGAATINAGQGARVFRKSVQNLNSSTCAHQVDTTICGRDADVKNLAVHLGALRARCESYSKMAGSGARLELDALTIACGNQEFDQRTFQDHAAPHATSNLLYKNALLDEARTIFAGMIRVEPGAEETDAYQQNRNLLLNPAAEADSLPGLEIQNQNVRCTHGATTSRLDPEELFYLRSRGIPKNAAYQLLVFGFFEEIIQKVEDEALAELLRELARKKFEK